MTTQNNFKTNQRQAKKNSLRLTLMFVIGMIVTGFTYFSMTHYALGYCGYEAPSTEQLAEERLIISAGIASFLLLIMLLSYLFKRRQLKRKSADYFAVQFGASELPPQRDHRQQQYANVVEEMAINSGIQCPNMYYLFRDKTINAFVTGGCDDSVAITISQGALDYLTPDELHALIARKFEHILNRDIFLNNRLIAVTHSFSALFNLLMVSAKPSTWFNSTESSLNDNDSFFIFFDSDEEYISEVNNYDINKFLNLILIIPLILISLWKCITRVSNIIPMYSGKIIRAIISRQQQRYADEYMIKDTGGKAVLISLLSKAMASRIAHIPQKMPIISEHYLFINYRKKWLSTHLTLEKRVKRYGRSFSTSDLDALHKRMCEYSESSNKPINEKERALKAEKYITLSMLQEHQHNLANQSAESANKAACAVLAQFVILSKKPVNHCASQFKWSKSLQTKIKRIISARLNEHACTHIQTFLHQLPMLAKHPKKDSLMKQIYLMIKADNTFDLAEMCYLLCLRQGLQEKVPESERQDKLSDHKKALVLLLNFCTLLNYDGTIRYIDSLKLMQAEIAPNLTHEYREPKLDTKTIERFYKDIASLANLKKMYRNHLVKTIEKYMSLDKELSTEQNELLFALKRVLA